MNFQLRRSFSSLLWSSHPETSMAQGPFLNQLGIHISSLSVGGGDLYRTYSQLKFKKGKLSRMNIANSLKAPRAIRNVSIQTGASDEISILAAPRFYYKPIVGGSRFGWPSFSASAYRTRCYSQFPKSQVFIKDDVLPKEKRGGASVLASRANFDSNRKLPKALAARSRKSADGSTSGSRNHDTIVQTQELSTKQDDKAQVQQEHSRTKKNNKKQKSGVTVVDEDSQSKCSGIKTPSRRSSSETKLEDNLNGNKLEESLRSSASPKRASRKKAKSQSAKMTAESLEKQGQPVKVTTDTPEIDRYRRTPSVNSRKGSNLKPLYPPSGKSVVVVESATKAKVIQRYLGDMFEVLPSYGHVRDLAARSGSVRPDEDFSMVWEVPSPAWTHLKSIKVALSGADNLILASDPDREGEAIAWHIIEMLQQQDALRDNITIARVVFHEITESSIKAALQSPRDIDANLVNAYLARRALDYLIGFNISPLLWRKLPGCQSAGRVQSAALSLICDREMEIDEFKPQEYWSIEAGFNKSLTGSPIESVSFMSNLTYFASKKLNQLAISSNTEAKNIQEKILSSSFKVMGSKINKTRKNPPTPYITSTLQQDAANKLHFPATYTMKVLHYSLRHLNVQKIDYAYDT
ncbi:hypothetical protein CRG98_028803 [Punica granatum]|uniref:Uncharacterized protein n=1 Tax=Punica granatum TaxID=22663 RepID=A0A2I0J3J3_PUNGR|nr:hypothetical protein CRG98_028803 [Punica granatum]